MCETMVTQNIKQTLVLHHKLHPINQKCARSTGTQVSAIRWLTIKVRERSGSVFDLRLRGSGLEPHQRHCVVVLEQDTFTEYGIHIQGSL